MPCHHTVYTSCDKEISLVGGYWKRGKRTHLTHNIHNLLIRLRVLFIVCWCFEYIEELFDAGYLLLILVSNFRVERGVGLDVGGELHPDKRDQSAIDGW